MAPAHCHPAGRNAARVNSQTINKGSKMILKEELNTPALHVQHIHVCPAGFRRHGKATWKEVAPALASPGPGQALNTPLPRYPDAPAPPRLTWTPPGPQHPPPPLPRRTSTASPHLDPARPSTPPSPATPTHQHRLASPGPRQAPDASQPHRWALLLLLLLSLLRPAAFPPTARQLLMRSW